MYSVRNISAFEREKKTYDWEELISVIWHQIHNKVCHFGNKFDIAAFSRIETRRRYVAKMSAILDRFGPPISDVPDNPILWNVAFHCADQQDQLDWSGQWYAALVYWWFDVTLNFSYICDGIYNVDVEAA